MYLEVCLGSPGYPELEIYTGGEPGPVWLEFVLVIPYNEEWQMCHSLKSGILVVYTKMGSPVATSQLFSILVVIIWKVPILRCLRKISVQVEISRWVSTPTQPW